VNGGGGSADGGGGFTDIVTKTNHFFLGLCVGKGIK
jgi:hypothetical protein